MARFNLDKLLADVFRPVREDVVTIFTDLPHDKVRDLPNWRLRREKMAVEWRDGFLRLAEKIGLKVNPVVTFLSSGVDGGPLPKKGVMEGKQILLADIMKQSTLIVALTEYSVSSSLIAALKEYPQLRVASLPGVLYSAQETALAADYARVAENCVRIEKILSRAEGAEVVFATGERCYFDLRFRRVDVDDGMLPPDKKGFRLINLPSGEVFISPYEGERTGEPSKTHGEIPVKYIDELVIYKVEENRIVEIVGGGPKAREMRAFFEEDPARRNIAEFGLGCNECAVVVESDDPDIVRAREVEEEKAGFHWAYGLSDHFGGVWGVEKFKRPENAVHKDIIYAKNSPIGVKSIELIFKDGTRRNIWDGEWYIL